MAPARRSRSAQTRFLRQDFRPAAPLVEYVEHPLNPNEGDVGLLTVLLQENGFHGAAIAWATAGGTLFGVQAPRSQRFILAGAHRHRALVLAGAHAWPVFDVHCRADVAERVLLADNRSSAGHEDQAVLAAILRELHGRDNLAGTGYDPDDIDALMAQQAPPDFEPLPDTSALPDEAPRPDNIVLELPEAALRPALLAAVQHLLAAHPEWKADVT